VRKIILPKSKIIRKSPLFLNFETHTQTDFTTQTMSKKKLLFKEHRFFDEAGDTTFYGKGRIPLIGKNGSSNVFILGMVTFNEPLQPIRDEIIRLQQEIETSPYYRNVPSVIKRVQKKGKYFFHAKDDLPEIKKEFFDFIKTIDCSIQVAVGRKNIDIFENQHNRKEAAFYADLLSYLIKDEFLKHPRMVLNIAERASSTAINNLENGLQKAKDRFRKKYPEKENKTKVSFTVQKFTDEPLLVLADYLCWTVQRIFEKGETRYYDYVIDQIEVVIDVYDGEKIYNSENPLSKKNKVSPQTP